VRIAELFDAFDDAIGVEGAALIVEAAPAAPGAGVDFDDAFGSAAAFSAFVVRAALGAFSSCAAFLLPYHSLTPLCPEQAPRFVALVV